LGIIFRFFLTQSDFSPPIPCVRREFRRGDDSGTGPQERAMTGGTEMAVDGSRWAGQ
jgi:hypothetical protein